MRKASGVPALLLPAVLLVSVWAATPAIADEQAAARQYRVARRLVAEKSPEAAAALRKVVELAPMGPLADDALLEEGILAGASAWPSQLGLLTTGGMARAAGILSTVTEEHAGGDRVHEARYRSALLKMEPVNGQDLSGARLDLLAVANDRSAGNWAVRARYVASWIDRVTGHDQRARDSLERLRIDHPATVEGVLARIGLAQMILQDGDYGRAVTLLQENGPMLTRAEIATRVPDAGRITGEAVRSVAVRSLLMQLAGDRRWNLAAAHFPGAGIRSVTGFAAGPASCTVLTDRKTGVVVTYDEAGRKQGEWLIPGAGAATVDRLGRIWVAGESGLVLIRNDVAETITDLGAFAAPRAMAADTLGSIWLLDRKGVKIARLHPGGTKLEPAWQGEDRLSTIVWDGRRILALDSRGGRVVEIREANQFRTVVSGLFAKPVAMGSDLFGRFAVMDDKMKTVTLFSSDGVLLGAYPLGEAGPSKVAALVLYRNGGFGVTGSPGATVYRFR